MRYHSNKTARAVAPPLGSGGPTRRPAIWGTRTPPSTGNRSSKRLSPAGARGSSLRLWLDRRVGTRTLQGLACAQDVQLRALLQEPGPGTPPGYHGYCCPSAAQEVPANPGSEETSFTTGESLVRPQKELPASRTCVQFREQFLRPPAQSPGSR